MAQELEARVVMQVFDIALRAGEEIVGADHFMALRHQPVDQMRAEKARSTSDQDTLAAFIEARHPGSHRC